MEPETLMTQPTPTPVPPQPPPPTQNPAIVAKKPPNLLKIFGIVATILFTIALGIVIFGGDRSGNQGTQVVPDADDPVAVEQATEGWPKIRNDHNFFELAIPPQWIAINRSPLITDSLLFNAENLATMEITATKTILSLDDYLSTSRESNRDLIKSNKVTQVRVGGYDGFEHLESWPTFGLQAITTYVKISDMLYTFTLSPAGGQNAITNEAIIRNYHTALASFRLTDTSQLGKDLKEYQSQKVADLAFSAFSLKYPQTWVLTEAKTDSGLEVSIYRNNYEITISQKAVGGAVCLFSDSPQFEGSSGDLRSKQFSEFASASGATYRRYFNVNLGDKSTMFFCEKQQDGPYFQTPLSIGGLVYYVPAQFDLDIVKEMDEIVKSITLLQGSPQPVSE